MPRLALNEIDLYYELHGTGEPADPPLMLVAGLASDSQSWLPVLEPLSRHHRVIVLDNRGCGRTTPPDCTTGIGRMADDCIALADHLGIGRFRLLGHSMGGFIAIDCALRFPDRVARLVLANTTAKTSGRNRALFLDWLGYLDAGMAPAPWWRNFFYWIFTPGFFEDAAATDAFLKLVLEYPYPPRPDGLRGQVGAIVGFDRAADLRHIASPTLILCSTEDVLLPPGEDAAGLAGIPNARVAVLDGSAHASFIEAPDAFVEQVLAFLAAT